MHLGPARKRLSKENMLSYEEISEFCSNLASELGWKVIDEAPNSLIALVAEEEEDGGSGKRMTRVEPRVRDLEGAARGRAQVPGPWGFHFFIFIYKG